MDDSHPQALCLDQFYADFENALGQDWDVILVEGIFVLWEERILSRLDLKLFVDCDPDERLSRRVKRHLACGDELDEILERYVNAVKPRHMTYVEPAKWNADLILNGFCMPPLQLEILSDWIKKSAAK